MSSRFPRVCAAGGLWVGGAVFLGWILDIPELKSLVPGLATTKPNTAAAMALGGLGLLASTREGRAWRRLAIACGALLTLLTLATLLEVAAGWDLRIDEILFRAPLDAQGPHPLRMALPTAFGFCILGTGLLLLAGGRVPGSQIAALAALAPALLALIVYLYDLRAIAAFGPFSSMAVPTAATLALLAAGLFWARPGRGMTSILVDPGPGGIALRRLLPLALAVPILTGWLCLRLEDPRPEAATKTVALFVALTVATLSAGVLWAGAALERVESAQRAAASALRASEERFRGIAETLPHGLVLHRPDGSPDYASPYLARYLGLAPERLAREGWSSRVHAEDRARVQGRFQPPAAPPDAGIEVRLLRHDGIYRWNLLRGHAVRDGEGRFRLWIVTLTDVDEVRTTKLEIEGQARRLERSNRDLDRFTQAVASDLRLPLSAIAGHADRLSERLRGRLEGDADEFLAFIREGAARMRSLIDALLGYSRVGDREEASDLVDADEVLDGVLRDLGAAVAEGEAVIRRSPLPVVLADPLQLAQVFANLLSNAIKYRRAGRNVEIDVSAQAEKGGVRFSVRDNGMGIEAQHRERIFQLFQRLHGRREYEGTGIGLSICRRIVERQGGRIWVESTPGAGSTFHFTLPSEIPSRGDGLRSLPEDGMAGNILRE